ncbi:MAG: hypothetical protein RKO66_09780, partial [Candidatus Contendobacter sp.]|nr:hypothetical protein [Candidatus Contendobacter sp.]
VTRGNTFDNSTTGIGALYIVGIVVIVMTGNIAIIGLLILLFSMVKNGSSFFKGLFCGFSLGIGLGAGGVNLLGKELLKIAEGTSGRIINSIFIFTVVFIIFLPILFEEQKESQADMRQEPWKAYPILMMIMCGLIGLVAGAFTGMAIAIDIAICLCILATRAYYYPLHLFLIFPVVRGRLYPWHPVAWDDLCFIPFPGLDRLLVAYAEYAPENAHSEIKRLIDHYPSQHMAALRARTRLIARAAAREVDLSQLEAYVAQLPTGNQGFLAHTPRVREIISEISQLQRRFNSLDHLFLREPSATLLVNKIGDFQNCLNRLPRPLAREFSQAARQWRTIAENQQRQAQNILVRMPHPAAFRAGGSVDRDLTAFVLRESAISDLKRRLVLGTDGHPLILTGRGVGKSTLLGNLQDFLPISLHVTVLSLDSLADCPSQADFLSAIDRRMTKAILPSWPDFPALAQPTSPEFERWLHHCNAWLVEMKRRLLLAIDGYETLDRALNDSILDAKLLTTIAMSIQNHRQIVWCFVGNRPLSEVRHEILASCLANAQPLEVPPFTEAETRRLLTEPLRYSSLWRDDDPKRPRFNPDFWGDNGIERIHAEAGGWPHLVQLLAETIVDLTNDREQAQADRVLLDEAIAKAIVAGDAVLRQLMQPEDAAPGEWEYLRGFRTRDTQPPPDDEAVYQALRRRLLVAEEGGQWRLRVPLMQRWLRERG